jgi:HSP20 family molecular chaperone IbpA
MEENQNTSGNDNIKETTPPKCTHLVIKPFWVGLLIFLGAFCAFYVVADWNFKHMFFPNPRHVERMMERDMRSMDKMVKHENRMFKHAGNIIHMEQTPDFYKISIDLKAFDNNENNVNVSANGSILSISGRTVKKAKHNEQISEFQQNYLFGENVKLEKLSKETHGDILLIKIPIDNEEKSE